jgi:hypothetical protein
MGAAAAQEGAKEGANWERRQHKREQKREQNGSGGSPRGSKMGAAAAQEGAKEGANWERRQHKREQSGSSGSARGSKLGAAAAQEGAKWERRQEQHGEQRRADCCAFGSGVGVSSGFLLRRVFLWLCGVSGFGSAVRYLSGTPVCSFHAGFDFCHSGNAIRRCARAWNINTWAFSFTGDTSRSQRSRRPHRGCLAHARSLSSCVAKARSLAGCVARSRSRASNGVYATYAGLRWNGIFFS